MSTENADIESATCRRAGRKSLDKSQNTEVDVAYRLYTDQRRKENLYNQEQHISHWKPSENLPPEFILILISVHVFL